MKFFFEFGHGVNVLRDYEQNMTPPVAFRGATATIKLWMVDNINKFLRGILQL